MKTFFKSLGVGLLAFLINLGLALLLIPLSEPAGIKTVSISPLVGIISAVAYFRACRRKSAKPKARSGPLSGAGKIAP